SARGQPAPRDIDSARTLILSPLAIVYTLYFGKEIFLPVAVALVLKLLLQPAMRLLHERLRLPGAVAALLLIIAVFSAVAAVGFTISVPASGWIQKAPESLPLGVLCQGVRAGDRLQARRCALRARRSRPVA